MTQEKQNNKEVICNFEKHIDGISLFIQNGGGCMNCPVHKDGCKVWGSNCAEAFKQWALANADSVEMAAQRFVRTARLASFDNMQDMLHERKAVE